VSCRGDWLRLLCSRLDDLRRVGDGDLGSPRGMSVQSGDMRKSLLGVYEKELPDDLAYQAEENLLRTRLTAPQLDAAFTTTSPTHHPHRVIRG
jgi:hypothetical protein